MHPHYAKLKQAMEGQQILRLEIQEQKGEPHPEIILHLSNGAAITVMSDEEGNGNGALDFLRPPIAGAAAAPTADGWTPELIGKKFHAKGHTFTVLGFNARRPKFPVEVTREDGQARKAVLAWVLLNLRQSPAQ